VRQGTSKSSPLHRNWAGWLVLILVLGFVGACGQPETVKPDVAQAKRDCLARGHKWREVVDEETGETRYLCLIGGPSEDESETSG
jgi:hypothetical protein